MVASKRPWFRKMDRCCTEKITGNFAQKGVPGTRLCNYGKSEGSRTTTQLCTWHESANPIFVVGLRLTQ